MSTIARIEKFLPPRRRRRRRRRHIGLKQTLIVCLKGLPGKLLVCLGVYFAEIMAFIRVIERAYERDWRHLWLESNSTLVMHLL